jgi:hypothetical protein
VPAPAPGGGAIWVICLLGTVGLFMVVPKAFLPVGDSSVIFGVFIAREGSSPEQMQRIQDQADHVIRTGRPHRHLVHHDGERRLPVVEPGNHVHVPQAARPAPAHRERGRAS